ncbi:MAG TPA: sulfotransferase [Pseudolabrys sp.]|nr:sulfotransferase [Pseudolabrys sp.]
MKPAAVPDPIAAQIRADVLHIGYPKAASTFVQRYLNEHPEVTTDHGPLADLLYSAAAPESAAIVDKPHPGKVHVSRAESVAESVCVIGKAEAWSRALYVPGGWDRVTNDIVVDPGVAAARLHKVHPDVKVLLLIREQANWLQSAYKYVMSQLPAKQRSFADYCTTPSGIVHLQAGHFDQTIRAYADTFGASRLRVMRVEDLETAPQRFMAELCAFIGISERSLPHRRDNETNVQIARIQRLFPIIERLPRTMKDTLKPIAARLLPGGRGAILSSDEIRMLRGIYAASNMRTDKLLSQLSGRL